MIFIITFNLTFYRSRNKIVVKSVCLRKMFCVCILIFDGRLQTNGSVEYKLNDPSSNFPAEHQLRSTWARLD